MFGSQIGVSPKPEHNRVLLDVANVGIGLDTLLVRLEVVEDEADPQMNSRVRGITHHVGLQV